MPGRGERVLVHGGTSGIGSMAIKLGKLFGLTVYVTCGSDEKCDDARALGADGAINYKDSDFVKEIDRLTGGEGVHVVLDMVGGDYVPRNLNCLAPDGRHVSIAFQRGISAEISVMQIMQRRLVLTGSTLARTRERVQESAGGRDRAQCLAACDRWRSEAGGRQGFSRWPKHRRRTSGWKRATMSARSC